MKRTGWGIVQGGGPTQQHIVSKLANITQNLQYQKRASLFPEVFWLYFWRTRIMCILLNESHSAGRDQNQKRSHLMLGSVTVVETGVCILHFICQHIWCKSTHSVSHHVEIKLEVRVTKQLRLLFATRQHSKALHYSSLFQWYNDTRGGCCRSRS